MTLFRCLHFYLQLHKKYTLAKQLTFWAKKLYCNVWEWVLNTLLLNNFAKFLRTPFLQNTFVWPLFKFQWNYCLSQDKYTLKNKIANHLHFLTAQAFLFYFHCGAIPTLAPNARVAIFPVKHVSLHSITFITAILEESFIIGYAPCGWNWKPITLFSKSVFTLINKNVRELSLGNNEYTRDKDFLESLCHKLFSD